MCVVAVLTCSGVDATVLAQFCAFFQVRAFAHGILDHRGVCFLTCRHGLGFAVIFKVMVRVSRVSVYTYLASLPQ